VVKPVKAIIKVKNKRILTKFNILQM